MDISFQLNSSTEAFFQELEKNKKALQDSWAYITETLNTALLQQDSSTIPGGISIPGTGGTAGIDAGNSDGMTSTYSVAVYPSTESEENVESAEVASLTEEETLAHPLAEHLPNQLPDGFHYGRGSV